MLDSGRRCLQDWTGLGAHGVDWGKRDTREDYCDMLDTSPSMK
jgi:hypothetical protein